MSKLVKFLEENEKELTDFDNGVIQAGLGIMKIVHDERERQLNDGAYRCDFSINDAIEASKLGVWMLYADDGIRSSEKCCCDFLTMLWGYLMPDLELLKREFRLPSGKRIDFLAKDKETGVHVIIEAKHSSSFSAENSAIKQVNSYRDEYDRHAGKSARTMVITKSGLWDDSLDSLAWYELGITPKGAVAPDEFDTDVLIRISQRINKRPAHSDFGLLFSYEALKEYIAEYLD